MQSSWIEDGAVFQLPAGNDVPKRVLLHDAGVVMYDARQSHVDNWAMAKLSDLKTKQISYFVVPDDTLIQKATYLRTEPLTAEENAIHRPDLPFCLAQWAGLNWPAQAPSSAAEMAARLSSAGTARMTTLDAPEIYLYPFGPHGGRKAGVRVRAENGTAFPLEELIWRAATIQAKLLTGATPTEGIGIYREGLQRGIPAYYLWGNQSKLHTQIAEAAQRRHAAG